MVRIKNPISEQSVKRMAVRIPTRMVGRIETNLLASGYNKKQRLFWFEDIINELFATRDYHNLVAEEFIEAGTTKVVNFSITTETYKKIEVAIREVAEQENSQTDKSSVIRTAILQRLLKDSGISIGGINHGE